MAGTSETEPIKIFYSEIDEALIRVEFVTQNIKAQEYLIKKLKNKENQLKERFSFIVTANSNLQSEITHAEREITSLLTAEDTIKKANVELKMEVLLAKERKVEMAERIERREKKYEDLWIQCKARFESLPHVQRLLKAQEEVKNIKQRTEELEAEERSVREEIKNRIKICRETDNKRIVEFAEFMVIERPRLLNLIEEKTAAIEEIVKELDNLEPKTNDIAKPADNEDWKPDNDCTSIMPKLQLNYFDFNTLNANLDKIKGDDLYTKSPDKTYTVHSVLAVDPRKVNQTRSNTEYFPTFFYNCTSQYSSKTQNYAKKKLINILDDIKVDKDEAQKMLADANPGVLQPVESISIDDHQTNEDNWTPTTKEIYPKSMEIEEITLTASNTEKLLMPPTQFLDMTPEVQVEYSQKVFQKEHQEELDQASTSKEQSSQEEPHKKKVKFDLCNNEEVKAVNEGEEGGENEYEMETNETLHSQVDADDDGMANMKDMIMKKHNLDLSPQFVYSKNVMTSLNSKPEEAVVTSKFFPQEQNQKDNEDMPPVVQKVAIEEDQVTVSTDAATTPMEINQEPVNLTLNDCNKLSMEVSGSNKQNVTEQLQANKPICELFFGQDSQMTSDFLEESNITGLEESNDLPSFLDTSLLMSPKADFSVPTAESQEVQSQEGSNFLSALRKTGMPFFGNLFSEPKPDPEASSQNQSQEASGFNFNFGGEGKKTRGGLFSMFQ